MYYWTCPNCGSNLDPCEKCDCLETMELKATDVNDIDIRRSFNLDEYEERN